MDRVFQSITDYALSLPYQRLPGEGVAAHQRWVKAFVKEEHRVSTLREYANGWHSKI